jgi:hypothetical protein
MSRSFFFAVASSVLFCTMPLAAQDAVLGQLYGNGVHAYFGQDYVKAHELFTQAIDGHTQDPRAYYFRGLDLLKLGRPHEAEADFKQGAKLESAIDPSRVYNVARALERIQGSDRARLESFRLEARMTVLQKAEKEHALRYQESLKEQRDFLQKQSTAPVEGPKSPDAVPPSKAAGPPPVPEEPFSPGEPGKATGQAAPPPGQEMPAEKPAAKPEASPEPFGPEPAKPAAPAAGGTKKPDAGDPFGPGQDLPKPSAPAAGGAKKPADAGVDDPFGAGAGGDAGKSAPATPDAPLAPPKKPASAKAPDAGDPFAAEPDAAKPAAPATSAAPAKKPDAKPAAGDDPFAP